MFHVMCVVFVELSDWMCFILSETVFTLWFKTYFQTNLKKVKKKKKIENKLLKKKSEDATNN